MKDAGEGLVHHFNVEVSAQVELRVEVEVHRQALAMTRDEAARCASELRDLAATFDGIAEKAPLSLR